MKKLFKIAQEFETAAKSDTKDCSKKMNEYVSMLRALSIIHQVAHWTSKGDNYYGDHELFGRLYDDSVGHVDQAAEKSIGVFNTKIDLTSHCEMASKFVDSISGVESLVERSLKAEMAFLEYSKELYNHLSDNDCITLGLDDMIMAIASKHEEFVYLLKQRSIKS